MKTPSSIDRNDPPAPASPPATRVAIQRFRKTLDPAVSAASGSSPVAPHRQSPCGSLKNEPDGQDHHPGDVHPSGLREQRLSHPRDVGEKWPPPRCRTLQQHLRAAEHLSKHERGQPEGQDIDADPHDYLIGVEPDRKECHGRREYDPGDDREYDAHQKAPRQVGSEESEEGACQHEALEPDVEHARAFG